MRRCSLKATRSAALAGSFVALSACGRQSEPASYVLVSVDTNASVPALLNQVRIDVFSADGTVWQQSRSASIQSPRASVLDGGTRGLGAEELPLSFALIPGGGQQALIRIRGFREGKVRDYLGERFAAPPSNSRPQPGGNRCERAGTLKLGGSLILAVGAERTPGARMPGCRERTAAGDLAAAEIDVPADGRYHFEIDEASPGDRWDSRYGDPILFLVQSCESASPVLACSDDGARGDVPNVLPSMDVELKAGRYTLLVGNKAPEKLEARLVWTRPDLKGSAAASADAGVASEQASVDDAGPTAQSGPRLLVDDLDVTPSQEPDPALAVDRLSLIAVESGVSRSVRIALDGNCFGVMADLQGKRSCRGAPGLLEPITPEVTHGIEEASASSVANSWPGATSTRCDPTADDAERVCVPGGVFILGDSTIVASGADSAVPERIVIVDSFYIDRHEFTVGRYRRLLKDGAPAASQPFNNFERLDFSVGGLAGNYCTYNTDLDGEALFADRETMPLSCVSWIAAQQLCAAAGGRLPTSLEWEYAASAAGKSGEETLYPWGNTPAECDQAVLARWAEESRGHNGCFSEERFGPAPVDDVATASLDRTPLGILGLAGNVSEWTLDSHRAYTDHCWQEPSMRNASCQDASAPLVTVKGGSWRQAEAFSRAPVRFGAPRTAIDDGIGFRCVYTNSQ
jgi:formylglycine-generating enzyme required for sulfatase activity